MQVEEKSVSDNFKGKTTVTVADNFPEKLDKLINNIIMKEGYKSYDMERKTISTNGGSYLGVLYEIDVKGETRDGAKETNIFVKNIVSNEDNLKVLSIPQAYKTEMFAYKKLCKVFDEIQNEAVIPVLDRFKMVKSFDECNSEAIILDNVARKGYKTAYRMDVVSLKYAELAIQQLAKFHAFSFVMKEKRPNYFNENIKTLETAFIFGADWQGFMKSMCDLTVNCLDDEMKRDMEKIFPRLLEKFPRYIQDESNVSCLCHGDYRPNNIMIKKVNEEVVDLIPIDYQLMHFGCPVHDFLYFIYTSTDRIFRKKHFTLLKDLYYEAMGRFLEYFDINVEIVQPRVEFERVLKERLDFGLIITIIFRPFIFVDENDVPDVSKDNMANISFKLNEKYKDLLQETVEEFIDWGFLKDY